MNPLPEPEPLTSPQLPRPDAARAPANCLRKIAWRLVPFLCLLYVFNILDRSNLGAAREDMEYYLEMPPAVFEWGYGIFYFGYLVFEVPANLLLRRFGARRWLARILITWGLVSVATLAVTESVSFYTVRILLGVAEAGFFPGIVLYLTYWFPARERVRISAFFMLAIPLAGILGNPLSGAILEYTHGVLGLWGWQWLFLLEGFPSVLLGIVVLYYLPDNPAQANWLTPDERTWLQQQLDAEDQHRSQGSHSALRKAAADPRVWWLTGLYFTVAMGANAAGAAFFKLIDERFTGCTKSQIGLLSALPHVCALVGMTLLAAHSDRTGERRGHVALAAFVAAVGWAIGAVATEPWLFLLGLCLAQMGMISMLPPFWALPTAFLSGIAAAGGIALINSVANIGGFFGPRLLGAYGLGFMAVALCIGGILALGFRPAR